MNRLGEKLRILRQRHGFSQTHLSELLEVSQTFVGKLERGEKTPNLVMLLKITQIFNVSADILINDELTLDD